MTSNMLKLLLAFAIPIAIDAAAKVDYDKELFKLIIPLRTISKPDIEAIKSVLNHKANINAPDHDYFDYTPLCYAINRGFNDLVILLLKEGAIPDTRMRLEQVTALHLATGHRGRIDIVDALLKNGATVDIRDANKSTPLHLAAFWGNINIINLLLESGANYYLTNNKSLNTLAIVNSSKYLNPDEIAIIIKLIQDYDALRELMLDQIPKIILDKQILPAPLACLIAQYCFGFSEPCT